jgi:tetratricopeptide (TPR) repeat protein
MVQLSGAISSAIASILGASLEIYGGEELVTMTTTTIQSELIRLLERARAERQAWVESLSAGDRAASGTPESWSAKDDLAHIAFWARRSAERVGALSRGEEPDSDLGDFQLVNERVFEERRGWTWEQVQAELDDAHDKVIDHIRALDDSALSETRKLADGRERVIASDVLGNVFWHVLEHVARRYAARGETERATQMLEGAIVVDNALAGLPADRANALYNLACFYATTGQPDRALPLLPESYRLNPSLVEWSKQDTDLDSLRDRAAFQALYDA